MSMEQRIEGSVGDPHKYDKMILTNTKIVQWRIITSTNDTGIIRQPYTKNKKRPLNKPYILIRYSRFNSKWIIGLNVKYFKNKNSRRKYRRKFL